jgi:hypothetical protein
MVASRRGYNRNDIHAVLETLMSLAGLAFGPDEAGRGGVASGLPDSNPQSVLDSRADQGGPGLVGVCLELWYLPGGRVGREIRL